MTDSAAQRLGRYIAGESLAWLPDDVVAKAKLCLIDSLGCFFGARATPVAKMVDGFASDLAGGSRIDDATTAFTLATLINALDYDDIYKKGHLGATVIAAVLAVGRSVEVSGAALLEAIVVGYEVSGRVGISLVHETPRKEVHGHGTWQTLGAVASAAKLLQLDAAQTAHAIAIAAANAPLASVMKTVYGDAPTIAKNNFGVAAQVGVQAAFLARRGFTGPLDIFEGTTGFWRMFGADRCDLGVLTQALGESYEIREVGFKPYSCCRILQSSIEAAVKVVQKAGIDPRGEAIDKLVISAPAIVCGGPFANRRPVDMWAAQFSAPYAIALAVLQVEPGPDWFVERRFNDPAVLRLIDKIELQPYAREGSHHAAKAQLQTADSRHFETCVEVARGEAANPLPKEFLEKKFTRLVTGAVGEDRAAALLRDIHRIEKIASVKAWLSDLSTLIS